MEPFVSQNEEYCPYCDDFYTLDQDCGCVDKAKTMEKANELFKCFIKSREAEDLRKYIENMAGTLIRREK
jgi:hypothetical protein